jgi:MraZ protein
VAQGTANAGAGGAVFRGVTHVALDSKGRLAIPARYRDGVLGAEPPEPGAPRPHLVITVDPSGCLLLYPRAQWEPIQARLMSLSSFNEPIRRLQRLLVGHADDVELDAAGRILIPPELRAYASLDHRVVLVGQGNKFEIWDEPRWREQTAQAITFSAGTLPAELDGFSL